MTVYPRNLFQPHPIRTTSISPTIFALNTSANYVSGSNCDTGNPRHFTDFSNEAMEGSDISSSMRTTVDMMNPMYFIMAGVTTSVAAD